MSNFNKVGTFMKTFGQEVKTKPSFSTEKINKLRIDLIKEELQELNEGFVLTSWPKVFIKVPTLLKFDILLL